MALLSSQQIQITGTAQTLTAAAASDTMPYGDRLFLWVKTTGTATTVTITPPGTHFGQAHGTISVVCPSTGDRLIGPLSQGLADGTTGLITAAFSGALTGVTRALVAI